MKKVSVQKQEIALSLRKAGLSHRDIAKQLHIGLGSAFLYTKSIQLSHKQHRRLKTRAYKKGLGLLSKEKRRMASAKGGKNGHQNYKTPYSKEVLLSIIRKFVKQNGRIPTKRESSVYRQVLFYFGTWNKAIEKAGFSPNPVLFANKFIANDGHKCDSLAEKIIDDWLHARNIPHMRNVRYINSRFTADFVVNKYFIEFFGLHGELKSYDALMKKKLKLIKDQQLKLISLYPEDIFPKSRLDEKLHLLK